ncbi:hypothetical protein CVM52_09915 [Pseudooceanicola lipolyticus]|uniref:DUF5337 domain-containing protein n=1 Tax=Pseudooceanicola lipolyticus TaxID=2029104 RepID=A0A2M8J268_9RHOB|nr:DUF5337 family protein [Pseudooceanicola lipolyticus]PJE36881.1 hypothetical protein CVM52_09915 [Pseudooceanicola lipolyticus]
MTETGKKGLTAGQRTALLTAGAGLFWILANAAGAYWGWSNRTRALFDLITIAAFGLALWQTINLWRTRRDDKG